MVHKLIHDFAPLGTTRSFHTSSEFSDLHSLKCCWLPSSAANHAEGIHAKNAAELIGTVELGRILGHTQ